MATRTISNGGGNYNSTGTWVEGVAPVAGDAIVATATSGNVTMTVNGAAASADFTNYTGKWTINSGIAWTLTSTLKFVGTMTVGGTGSITMNGTSTMTSAGIVIPWTMTLTGSVTYTLADDWHIGLKLTLGSSSLNPVINGNTFHCLASLDCGTTGSITGTTVFSIEGGSWLQTAAGTYNVPITLAGNVTFGTGATTLRFGTATLLYSSGTITNTGSTLLLLSSCTLTLGASCHLNQLTLNAALTITLGADLWLDGSITVPNANVAFAGAFDLHTVTWVLTALVSTSKTFTFPAGQTVYINNAMVIAAPSSTLKYKFQSGTGGSATYIVFQAGAHMALIYIDFADVDATRGAPILQYGGTASGVSQHVFSDYPSSIGGFVCPQPTRMSVLGAM